jgi:serine/threonine protein kinase
MADARDERRAGMTTNAKWEEVERLFHEAVDLPEQQRQAVLASASAEVREEVESLLKTDEEAVFVERPIRLAADLLEGHTDGLSAGQRVGEFEIESLIATGGMGQIYRARHQSGIPVALKILRRHLALSPQAVDRFQTEARAASALHDPNIVTVYASGDSPSGLFLAMEWVEGPTFRQLIAAGLPQIADAARWSEQAASALAAAHAAGILHRDIKPENIILRTADDVVKILDFGLARLAGPVRIELESIGASGTISGTLSGTLLYMSPEILRGETASSASDVFSLGALVYELWTGRHPFAGETPLDVFEAIECRVVAAPSELRPGISEEVDSSILHMLDRDPALRPSAIEARDVFSRFSERT